MIVVHPHRPEIAPDLRRLLQPAEKLTTEEREYLTKFIEVRNLEDPQRMMSKKILD